MKKRELAEQLRSLDMGLTAAFERIQALERKVDKLEPRVAVAWRAAPTLGRLLSPAPCDQCGYNGEGYYQPSKHPCAEAHHRMADAMRGTPVPPGEASGVVAQASDGSLYRPAKPVLG